MSDDPVTPPEPQPYGRFLVEAARFIASLPAEERGAMSNRETQPLPTPTSAAAPRDSVDSSA